LDGYPISLETGSGFHLGVAQMKEFIVKREEAVPVFLKIWKSLNLQFQFF
jgi:hypothetical protein